MEIAYSFSFCPQKIVIKFQSFELKPPGFSVFTRYKVRCIYGLLRVLVDVLHVF